MALVRLSSGCRRGSSGPFSGILRRDRGPYWFRRIGRPDGCLGNVRMLISQLSFSPSGIPVVGEDQVAAAAICNAGSSGVTVDKLFGAALTFVSDD